LNHFDSAATDLAVLADSLGQRQEKKLTGFYVSRANIYYAQGTAYIQRGDTAAARAAFEQALTEDLGFHMASVRLSGRALASGDTTTALSHLAHAVAVSPGDPALRLYYGIILSACKQSDDAREQFLKGIEMNPNFAQPYMHFAQEIEGTDLGSAIASYETFLLRSARNDASRAWVAQRLRRLVGPP
jgi:Tfp pilus assembly protein PilF